jgi:hypothetical protein
MAVQAARARVGSCLVLVPSSCPYAGGTVTGHVVAAESEAGLSSSQVHVSASALGTLSRGDGLWTAIEAFGVTSVLGVQGGP